MLKVSVDGELVLSFEIELAEGEPGWWAPLDVGSWSGINLSVSVDAPPEEAQTRQPDTLLDLENLCREALRPQLHFSSKRGCQGQ